VVVHILKKTEPVSSVQEAKLIFFRLHCKQKQKSSEQLNTNQRTKTKEAWERGYCLV